MDADPQAWAERLEALRRSVSLELDREGRWSHDGEPFTHPRLIALFDRGIDAHPDSGEPIVHIGDRWCYFKAEDTAFIVRRLSPTDAGLEATLNNSERWEVPPTGFEARGAFVYVQLSPRRRARLSRGAQNQLWAWLDADATPPEVVAPGGHRLPIRGA